MIAKNFGWWRSWISTAALCAMLVLTSTARDRHNPSPSRPAPTRPEPRRPAPQPPTRPRPRPEHPRPEPRHGRAPSDGERQEARRHWDGRRFDRDYWERYYGPRHPFLFWDAYWIAEPCAIGSTFYMDGAGFVLVEQLPDAWCGGAVYIEDMEGRYVVMNPEYPGAFYTVIVTF